MGGGREKGCEVTRPREMMPINVLKHPDETTTVVTFIHMVAYKSDMPSIARDAFKGLGRFEHAKNDVRRLNIYSNIQSRSIATLGVILTPY